MSEKFTIDDFIKRGEKKFKGKFDYSQVNFIDMQTEVNIICPIHGIFPQKPRVHLDSVHGCPRCAIEETVKKKTDNFEKFIQQLKDKGLYHEDYIYHKETYVKKHDKMKITCSKHGDFLKSPKNLLLGCKCDECQKEERIEKISYPYEYFIEKAKAKFNTKFKYDEGTYKNFTTPMRIFCQQHGWFEIKPTDFLSSKYGCPECGIHHHFTLEEIAEKSKEINGDKYEYLEYNVKENMITMKCKKHDHIFKQTTYSHLKCHQQCPICAKNTSILEEDLKKFLIENGIVFEEQKKFDWLRYKHKLSLDFYLPQFNVAIECQGKQHFGIDGWSRDLIQRKEDNKVIEERDKCKRQLCEENGVKLLYYSNLHIEYPYHVYENKEELMEEILKNE